MSLHRFMEILPDGTYRGVSLAMRRPGTSFTPIMDFVLRPSAMAAMRGLVPGHDATSPPPSDLPAESIERIRATTITV